ncbi:MAG: FG-GAP repeat domain-containing protein [Planctomycetota bacterium]|jgi:hypothetical protein
MLALATSLLASVLAPGAAFVPQDFGPEQALAHPASYAASVFAGDLDGDGDTDHAYAGHTTVAWYENRGPIGFRQAQVLQQVPTGIVTTGFLAIAGGDLDGDGDLDLVASNNIQGQVVLFENLGGGVFAEAQILANFQAAPFVLRVDDLDQDGDLDVLYPGSLASTVVWVKNTGGGNFAFPQVLGTTNDTSYGLVVDDFDQDGDKDLAVCGHERAGWFENLGDEVFAPQVQLDGATQSSRDLIGADMDGDGDTDLVMTSVFGEYVALFRNQGSGFSAKELIAQDVPTADTVVSGDFDGDGDQDLALGYYDFIIDGEILVFANDGTGALAAPVTIDQQIDVVSQLVAIDFDGDGALDLVSAVRDAAEVVLYTNDGAGQFPAKAVLTDPLFEPRQVLSADMDGDGDLDVVGLSRLADQLVWYENAGSGSFEHVEVLLQAPGEIRKFAVFDADQSGALDLALAGDFGIFVYLASAAGGFDAPIVLEDQELGWEVASGDLDGDGWEDLAYSIGDATGFAGPTRLELVQNQGGGAFSPPAIVANDSANGVLIADVAGSELPDFLYVLGYFQTPTYVQNEGQFPFPDSQGLPTTLFTGSVSVGDVDDDGDNDILVSDFFSLRWFENEGNGFGPQQSLIGGQYENARVDDLNGDGVGDLLLAGEAGITWAAGLGGGFFGPQQSIEDDFLSASRVLTGDLDGDGGLDVLGTDYFAHNLSWYPNRMTADCNGNGVFDAIEIDQGTVADCDGNGVPDACDLALPGADVDGDGQLDVCVPPALSPSRLEASLAGGGAQRLALTSTLGSELYLLLSTVSGTAPGTPVGGVTVPLNLDDITLWSIASANVGPYIDSLGFFEPDGTADAVFTVPAGESSDLAGVELHHAYVVLDSAGVLTFASNPVPLTLVP